jgi:hypothetical protein
MHPVKRLDIIELSFRVGLENKLNRMPPGNPDFARRRMPEMFFANARMIA